MSYTIYLFIFASFNSVYVFQKPGSHVLYLGDVCGITVLQLSDLVGSVSYIVCA